MLPLEIPQGVPALPSELHGVYTQNSNVVRTKTVPRLEPSLGRQIWLPGAGGRRKASCVKLAFQSRGGTAGARGDLGRKIQRSL